MEGSRVDVRWLLVRAALAMAACGLLVGGYSGLLLQAVPCLFVFVLLGTKHDGRALSEPHLSDMVTLALIAFGCSAVAALLTGQSGAASLTFIAGAGAAMERNIEAERKPLHSRAAWAAGVALLAFFLLDARAWPAAGADAQADTENLRSDTLAAAAVAATALSMDSLDSAKIGAYALFAAFAGATFGGHMPPSAVSVVVHVMLVAALLVVGCVSGPSIAFVSAFAYIAILYGGMPDFVRTFLYGTWTLALIVAVGVSFFSLPAMLGLREAGPRATMGLLLASCPGLLLATALPATPERVALSGAALMGLSVVFEAAFGPEENAAVAQQVQNAQAQVQQVQAQMAQHQAPARALVAADADSDADVDTNVDTDAADADTGAAEDALDPDLPQGPGDSKCCICLEEVASHACLPCGHKCACRECLTKVRRSKNPICPICRRRIKSINQIFSAV
jgi:hypothetical protein